jgi:hypothetical protein
MKDDPGMPKNGEVEGVETIINGKSRTINGDIKALKSKS